MTTILCFRKKIETADDDDDNICVLNQTWWHPLNYCVSMARFWTNPAAAVLPHHPSRENKTADEKKRKPLEFTQQTGTINVPAGEWWKKDKGMIYNYTCFNIKWRRRRKEGGRKRIFCDDVWGGPLRFTNSIWQYTRGHQLSGGKKNEKENRLIWFFFMIMSCVIITAGSAADLYLFSLLGWMVPGVHYYCERGTYIAVQRACLIQ